MKNIFTLNADQKTIINRCKQLNSGEDDKWYLQNVFFPLVVFALTLLLAALFMKERNLIELATNGSLSLIGINILVGMSSYLIKFDLGKSKIDIERVNLREKLGNIGNILIVVGSLLYAAQNLYIFNFDWILLVTLVLALSVLIYSINIGLKLFLIRDDFYQKAKAFDEEMRDDQENLNSALEDI
jgi:hypothetical protein